MAMAHRNWDLACKVYIGGLRDDANRYSQHHHRTNKAKRTFPLTNSAASLSRPIKLYSCKLVCLRYDLEDAFAKYGPVRNVWVARRPPGFAFVEMEDGRDAEDAARGLDGTRICGSRSVMAGVRHMQCFMQDLPSTF